MKNTFIYLSILIIGILYACANDATAVDITGKWQGISWDVKGKTSNRNAAAVNFQFNADGTYEAKMGQQGEKGKYHLTNNQLYSTAEGQIEKMVKINLKSKDTLIMDMNRVGTEEQLILVRK